MFKGLKCLSADRSGRTETLGVNETYVYVSLKCLSADRSGRTGDIGDNLGLDIRLSNAFRLIVRGEPRPPKTPQPPPPLSNAFRLIVRGEPRQNR